MAGGMAPQAAAWFCDVASLYVGAIAYEESIWLARENATEPGAQPAHEAIEEQLTSFFEALPPDRFPFLTSMATVMTTGSGDDRFEFGIDVLVSGLATVSERYRESGRQ
jgi:hypothetical protein